MKKLPLKILLKVQKNRLLTVAKELKTLHHKMSALTEERQKIEKERKEICYERTFYVAKSDFQKIESCDRYLEMLDKRWLETNTQEHGQREELQKFQEKYQALRHERKKIELLVEKR